MHETCYDWLKNHDETLYLKSIAYKGPLLHAGIMDKFVRKNRNITSLKKALKVHILQQQSSGEAGEWLPQNFMLYNITGLRRTPRNIEHTNYSQFSN